MKTPTQDVIAQVMFYTGIGAFPVGITALILGIKNTQKRAAFPLILSGGACITHVVWYAGYLARGIAGTATSPLHAAWWSHVPAGMGAAALAFLIRHYLELRAKSKR